MFNVYGGGKILSYAAAVLLNNKVINIGLYTSGKCSPYMYIVTIIRIII